MFRRRQDRASFLVRSATALLLLVVFCHENVLSFTSIAAINRYSTISGSSTTLFLAKRTKRRRKRQPPPPTTSEESPATTPPPAAPIVSTGELPDFDLGEDDDDEVPPSAPKPKKKAAAPVASASLDEITPAMMGSMDKPARSVRELLNDRALESKMEFDDVAAAQEEELPDLPAVVPQPSKKKARQEARKAAAMAAAEGQDDGENPLASIPFLVNEKGDVSPIKIVEAGTWLFIGLLILWEIYINSPFFERAAPLIPVVYD